MAAQIQSSEPGPAARALSFPTPEHPLPPGHRIYKLTVAYRGTEFLGWQRQLELPTVQLLIEQALQKCWERPVVLHGSGRTDTGVHALAQVAHFSEIPKFKPKTLVSALNNNLPESIRITRASFAPAGFHSRFSATGKEYHYRILNQPFADPFQLDLVWHVPRPLDLDAIRRTFPILSGTHDFASFTSNPGYERESTVRTITHIGMKKKGNELRFIFRGEGFLYRMVRNLMGAIIKVGQQRISAADLQRVLEARERSSAPPTAPAHGLYLAKVFYGKIPGPEN